MYEQLLEFSERKSEPTNHKHPHLKIRKKGDPQSPMMALSGVLSWKLKMLAAARSTLNPYDLKFPAERVREALENIDKKGRAELDSLIAELDDLSSRAGNLAKRLSKFNKDKSVKFKIL